MRIDYSELAARYSAMTADEFGSINREDLAAEAKLYYDREMARRVPGWRYEEPTPEIKFLELIKLQKCLRRRYVIRVVCWVVFFLPLIIFSVLIPSGFNDARLYILGILLITGPLAVFGEISSARRTGYLILWLRRFHRRQQKPFQNILNGACQFMGMAMTIQDSSFRYSSGFGMARLVPLMGVLLFIHVSVGFFSVNRIIVDALMMFVFLLVATMQATLRFWGFLKFVRPEQEGRLVKLVQGIREGKVRNAGVLIFRSDDALWRSAVETVLRHADAAVVDVTEPSENVIWELETALAAMSPERILLVCAMDASAPCPMELPGSVQSELRPITVPLSRFPTFFYPKARGLIEEITSAKSARVFALREALVKCIAHAPAHDGTGMF